MPQEIAGDDDAHDLVGPLEDLVNPQIAQIALDGKFLEESNAAGLANLKGHRSVGGMRASIYNAVSEEAVDALIDFMADFEKTNG